MHKADEFWMMNKIRERGIFPVAIPSPVAFEVFDVSLHPHCIGGRF